MLHVLDFAVGDPLCQHGEHGPGDPLRIDVVITPELLLEAAQELLSIDALSAACQSSPSLRSRSNG
jgi:hypothetical protein